MFYGVYTLGNTLIEHAFIKGDVYILTHPLLFSVYSIL